MLTLPNEPLQCIYMRADRRDLLEIPLYCRAWRKMMASLVFERIKLHFDSKSALMKAGNEHHRAFIDNLGIGLFIRFISCCCDSYTARNLNKVMTSCPTTVSAV